MNLWLGYARLLDATAAGEAAIVARAISVAAPWSARR